MNVRNSFNKAGAIYDINSKLQWYTGKKLAALSKYYQPSAHDLLDLGCGTGKITQLLLAQYSKHYCHAIDISPALLEKARQRLAHYNVKIDEKDFDKLHAATPSFDIIFSNMALQWSNHLEKTLLTISKMLKPCGLLAFSIPTSGTLRELKPHFSINEFYAGETIQLFLTQCGYRKVTARTETITYSFADMISALQSIKNVGANFIFERKHKGLHINSRINMTKPQSLTYFITFFTAAYG